MGICICSQSLQGLALSLAPVAQLNIQVPPIMAQLGTMLSAAQLSAQASLSLALPGLGMSISASLAAQITAALNAAAQISAAFGLDIFSASAAARLSAIIGTINFNFGLFPQLAGINISAAMSLSAALSVIAAFQAQLGINLLGPQALLSLQAALGTGLGSLSASLAASASATASAQFMAAVNLIGGLPNLFPALNFLAQLQLQLPSISGVARMGMLNLSALLSLQASLQAMLGLSASASVAIQLALQPLSLLASLSLQAGLGMGSLALSAAASAQASLAASASLNAFANLQIPNLLPLSFAANFALQGGLISFGACFPGCPLYGGL